MGALEDGPPGRMNRVRRPTQADRLMAKAISLAVHPPSNMASAVELLARMAGGDPAVLRRAVERIGRSHSGQPGNVVEDAVLLLNLALAEVTEESGSS